MFFITSDSNTPAGMLWSNVIKGTANQIKGGTYEGIKTVIEVKNVPQNGSIVFESTVYRKRVGYSSGIILVLHISRSADTSQRLRASKGPY